MEDLKQLSQIYQRSINIGFLERTIDDKREPSQEDKMFMDLVQKSIVMREGHYELCLPFRDNVWLPDNQLQALQRLKSLQKKMTKNSKFCSDYKQFMQTVIDKGYAELVSEDELVRADGKVWYLPHHGKYHTKKTEKSNPADIVSRGVVVDDLLQAQWWIKGPSFCDSQRPNGCRTRRIG